MKKFKRLVLTTLLLVIILVPTKTFALEFTEVKDAEALISALEEGKNIKLTSDILGVDKTLLINKEITIDLNGNNISFTKNNSFEVIGGNLTLTGKGTVKEEVPYYGAVMLRGSANKDDINYSTLTVEKDVTLEGWSPIFINQLNGVNKVKDSYGVTVNLYGTLNGVADSTGDRGHGIYVNGNIQHKENYPVINIYDGAKITTPGDGIYAAGYAKWNIEGATINGAIGIGAKSGIFNLKNVYIKATDPYMDPKYWGNGIYSNGAAIQIESNNGYAGAIEITIDGGKYESVNAYAIHHYLASKNGENINNSLENLTIKNGTFIGGKDNIAINVVDGEKIAITGGTYSSSVAKYITDEYVESKLENNYVVAKKEVTVDTPTIDTTKPVEEVTVGVKENKDLNDTLKEALKDSKIDVSDINATILVEIINQKETEVPEEASKSINDLTKENSNIKLLSFFDITLAVKNNITGEALGNLTELNKKITFNMALPETITKVEEGYTRKYYVVRYHDGKSEVIPATVDGNIITFESDKFSTYALAYEDTKNSSIENPPTSDTVIMDLVVGTASVIGLLLVGKNLIKRKKYFN